MKLNLGCGAVVADGWVNVDYAVGARLGRVPVVGPLVRRLGILHTDWDPAIIVHDLRKPLPWADGSADAIYCSHTLEHLDRDDGRRLVAECHRVLKPGGLVRIVVPDLKGYVAEYADGRLPATEMLYELHVLGARQLGLEQGQNSGSSGGAPSTPFMISVFLPKSRQIDGRAHEGASLVQGDHRCAFRAMATLRR